jgi:shikimate kinase
MARLIFLVGFMGCGKTTVGETLSEIIGARFIDSDALVESAEGMDIPQIFASRGEAYFRTLERRAIAETVKLRRAVIATGGGAVINPDNVSDMRGNGFVAWLKADENFISRHASDGARPLLAGMDDGQRLKTIRALLREREPLYRSASHFVLDVSAMTPYEVAIAISTEIKRSST